MRALALIVLSGLACVARADVPACYPAEPGCTPGYVAHVADPPGLCVVWFDLTGLVPQALGYCLRYADIGPTEDTGSIADLWFGRLTKAEKDALITKQVTRELSTDEQAAFDSLLVHQPESVSVVSAHKADLDRATYYVIAGKRYTSRKRIAIGSPCYPSVYSDGAYAAIRMTQPIEVAVCARR